MAKEKFICAPPGPKSRAILARDRKVMSPSLTREYDFAFKDAKGVWVWDADGRRYLDFAAAVAVMKGVKIVRTHDVLETKKFLTILDELI